MRLGRLFNRQGSRRPLSLRARVRRWVRAGYDAAQTTDENKKHWAAADDLSAKAANSAEVRRILRSRARYEVANNSIAAGIVATLANDTVGTGPRLQVRTGIKEADQAVEWQFQRWAQAIDLAGKLRTMRRAMAVDGEAFGLLTDNPRTGDDVSLDLRLIEADQVATPDLTGLEPNQIDGIVFDEHGNPIEYHVLKEHPGDTGVVSSLWDYDPVSASSMIHWFRIDRPGQVRGIPELTPALGLFALLRRYVLAVVQAAEVAALPSGVLYTDAPPDSDPNDVEPFDTVELERGMLMTMPAGWRLEQVEAKQPNAEFRTFRRELINEIARCLNLPFNVAAGNSEGYNYASGRLDHQVYYRSITVTRSEMERTILDRLLRAWFDEAALIPEYLPDAGPLESWSWRWIWPGFEHVDPAKEAVAQATRLMQHTTTLAEEYARRGMDWEEALRQRAREMALMEQLGLPQRFYQYFAPEIPVPREPEDE